MTPLERELYDALAWTMDTLGTLGVGYLPGDEALLKAKPSRDELTRQDILNDRFRTHDAGHGTYYPGPCEDCLALGWVDKHGHWIIPTAEAKPTKPLLDQGLVS